MCGSESAVARLSANQPGGGAVPLRTWRASACCCGVRPAHHVRSRSVLGMNAQYRAKGV